MLFLEHMKQTNEFSRIIILVIFSVSETKRKEEDHFSHHKTGSNLNSIVKKLKFPPKLKFSICENSSGNPRKYLANRNFQKNRRKSVKKLGYMKIFRSQFCVKLVKSFRDRCLCIFCWIARQFFEETKHVMNFKKMRNLQKKNMEKWKL